MSVGDAYAVGERYEATLTDADRRAGAHYTPPAVAELLVARALDAWSGHGHPLVCDPACGGGVFLVAAAEALARRGADPRAVVEALVVGIDVDPGAASAAREALRAWARAHGAGPVTPRVVVADALLDDALDTFGPDVVVGNPPFRSQLGVATARDAAERAALADRLGDVVRPYADHAALFAARAVDAVRHGVVALVLPRSFLVARDSQPARECLLSAGALREVWFPPTPVFRAKVDVVTVVVATGATPGAAAPVRVAGGGYGEEELGAVATAELAGAATWSPLWATAHGVPPVDVGLSGGTLGDHATATAGFRDQFYGVARHASEAEPPGGLRIATTAMVDPLVCRWGEVDVRMAGARRRTPWLDAAALSADDERLGAWVRRTAVPKVLVATQTRVIEAAHDPAGLFVPLTPLIAVVPTGRGPGARSVAHLAAALTSPVATAWALRRFGGSGLSSSALKLAARDVLEVPVPPDGAAWDAAAALVAGGAGAAEVGEAMQRAWDADAAVGSWWRARLPLH